MHLFQREEKSLYFANSGNTIFAFLMDKEKELSLATLKRLFAFVKPYRSTFFISLFLAVFLAAISPIRPYLIQLTIDAATGNHVQLPVFLRPFLPETASGSALQLIFDITFFQIIFIIFETALRFIFGFLTALLGQNVVHDLRTTTFKKVLGLDLKQFDITPIGTLTTRTIDDIERTNDVFSDGLIPIIADLLSIITILIVMFSTSWQVTLVCLIPFPFLIIATYYFKESVNKSFIKVRNAVAALNAFIQEHLSGMMIIQAFTAEKREFKKFVSINKEHRDANIKSIFAYSVFFPIVEIVLALSTGLLVWWIAAQVMDGNEKMQVGWIVSFALYLNLIFRPLRLIADKFNVLQMGMIAAQRVFKVLDNSAVMKNEGQLKPENFIGNIEFRNVWFAYNGDDFVLKDISFSIEAGQTVAIVGHTGSGKTSVINILNRFYPIQKGEIKVDGRNILEYDVESLRSNIGVVLQDVFLFSGSIAENTTLRNEEISPADVKRAAAMIGIDAFIEKLPGGYAFNVRERGAMLSLGQRQLLSFLRALLYNPSILILDEATSSIDTQSEQLIQHAIDTLIKGRTSIVIAHRLSTIKKAHKIIVLDKGEIKEMGTHQSLLAQNGFYARLYQMQFRKASHQAE